MSEGMKRLAFRDWSSRTLRRAAARNLRRAGAAEGRIMRIEGWRTRSAFERYAIALAEAPLRLKIRRTSVLGGSTPPPDTSIKVVDRCDCQTVAGSLFGEPTMPDLCP